MPGDINGNTEVLHYIDVAKHLAIGEAQVIAEAESVMGNNCPPRNSCLEINPLCKNP